MKKLLEQIIKFGMVGVLCFLIDFGIFNLLANVWNVHYLIANFFGFVISVVVNYLLSMKYVFARKDDIDRRAEFIIFVILSVIGLGLNEVIIFCCVDGIYLRSVWLQGIIGFKFAKAGSKVAATGLVMVYNFVTRKLFLEKKN